MKKRLQPIIIMLCLSMLLILPLQAASPISFSGGSTSITKTDKQLDVTMTGGAKVSADTITITADKIRIWGENYRYVRCNGAVKAVKTDDGITIMTPSLFFDRITEELKIDSWVEIQDAINEVALSGAHLDYNMKSNIISLQIQSRILKQTDDGLLVCSADSITYDSKNRTLVLSGRADVKWGVDSYEAARITIDLKTNEL